MRFSRLLVALSLLSSFLSADSINSSRSHTRQSDGRPAPTYWQQQVDYRINAELDVNQKKLTGTAIVRYHNNSPDTLLTLVWHLYQNVFKNQPGREKLKELVGRISANTDGIIVKHITVNNRPLSMVVNETILETPLPSPLMPGDSVEMEISWEYTVPTPATLRTGWENNEFAMAQWYPQIAVYDDLRGWDRTQYRGLAEFYTEYGNWDVSLTVPGNQIIAATGTLQNPEKVLTTDQLTRLKGVNDTGTVAIIPLAETDTCRNSLEVEKRTWNFAATMVRDFVWASSPRFIWDATKTTSGVLIQSYYLPDEFAVWKSFAYLARYTIEFMSASLGSYAYPQATIVSGPTSGMEYPMMVFISSGDEISNFAEMTVFHELSHEWYPMMIGSNETDHPFLDEGFVTFATSVALLDHYGEVNLLKRDFYDQWKSLLPIPDMRKLEQMIYVISLKREMGVPTITRPYDSRLDQYGTLAYQQPGAILFMLRDVLGTETFMRAMNQYYERWKFKHPSPTDFFNTMENVSGRDLDWFWNEWFFQTWKLDLALLDVDNHFDGIRWKSTINIENREKAVMPATVRIVLDDGSSRTVRLDERSFNIFNRTSIVLDSLPSRIVEAEIDPECWLVDINRMNNRWRFPKIAVTSFLHYVFNYVLPPVNAYTINVMPLLSYNQRDHFEIGLNLTGSYLGIENRTVLEAFWSRGIPDLYFGYSTPVYSLSPNFSLAFNAYRNDGFIGLNNTLSYRMTDYFGFLGTSRRTTTIEAGIHYLDLIDRGYLFKQTDWADGTLGRFKFKIVRANPAGISLFQRSAVHYEGSAPGSQFSFSKFSADVRSQIPFRGISWRTRLFGGLSNGAVPPQSQFSITQATFAERADTWLFHTPVFSRSSYEHFSLAGGGNLFRETDTLGNKIIALNTSISWSSFLFFADAGKVWNGDLTTKDLIVDAGLGFCFGGIGIATPQGSIPGIRDFNLTLAFPLFVKDPTSPTNDVFAWRWKIIYGIRL